MPYGGAVRSVKGPPRVFLCHKKVEYQKLMPQVKRFLVERDF